jgi:hypothetical protein
MWQEYWQQVWKILFPRKRHTRSRCPEGSQIQGGAPGGVSQPLGAAAGVADTSRSNRLVQESSSGVEIKGPWRSRQTTRTVYRFAA